MKIAIIGSGIMGSGMARNFLKNKHEVFVWNRTKENAQSLINEGAQFIDSPKEATALADMVIEVTANDESSKSVWLGEDGILSGADIDKTLITSSTLSIDWVTELSTHAAKYRFMDIPLTGGRVGAETGALTMLVGGPKNVFEQIKPVLESVANKFRYFGEVGSGTKFKLLLNTIQAIHIDALGEVLKVARESGMDMNAVGEALCDRPGGITTNIAWQGYQNPPVTANFSVKWITKDLKYAKKFTHKISTPLLDGVLNKYDNACKEGLGDKDWTSIMRF